MTGVELVHGFDCRARSNAPSAWSMGQRVPRCIPAASTKIAALVGWENEREAVHRWRGRVEPSPSVRLLSLG